jgi:uncharacterized membrane protein YsdA (DUF1294 family)
VDGEIAFIPQPACLREKPLILFWIVPFGLVILATTLFLPVGPIKNGVLLWFIAVNIMAFLVFGYDKATARLGQTRVPEKVLLAFAFMGGWPLAYLSMRLFRHKTSGEKAGFRKSFWILVAIEMVLLGILIWK